MEKKTKVFKNELIYLGSTYRHFLYIICGRSVHRNSYHPCARTLLHITQLAEQYCCLSRSASYLESAAIIGSKHLELKSSYSSFLLFCIKIRSPELFEDAFTIYVAFMLFEFSENTKSYNLNATEQQKLPASVNLRAAAELVRIANLRRTIDHAIMEYCLLNPDNGSNTGFVSFIKGHQTDGVLNTVPLYKLIDKYASSMLFLRFDEEKPFLSNIQGMARKLMADKRSVLKPVNLEPSELLILSGVWNPNPKKAVEYPWDGAQEWD